VQERVAGLALLIVVAVASGGCGGASARESLDTCVRKHGGRVVREPTSFAEAAQRRGWNLVRVRTTRNGLTLLETQSRDAARDALRSVRDAQAALDIGTDPRPLPHRRGRLVYWWDAQPNRAERGLLDDCVDA
jgi:hypothetical protein